MVIDNTNQIKARFAQYDQWESKYAELITLARELEPLDDKLKLDKFKIKGCQSQVWLVPSLKAGKLCFKADSDAVLVKGIISLLVFAYNGQKAKDIIANPPVFLKEIGLMEHLSMNRSNGLTSMINQINIYANLFSTLEEKGVMDADL